MASQNKQNEAPETKTETTAKPRRSIKNPFLYAGTVVILIITVIAFVFLPSVGGSVGGGGKTLSFGSWNGKPISYTQNSYFARQVAQINDYLRQQGMSEQNFQFYAYQVWRMAFESAAVREAVLQSVAAAGFRVSQNGLDVAVGKNEMFQEDGKFSPAKFKATPLATRLSLRDSTLEDTKGRRFYEDVYSLSPNKAEIDFIASMARSRRSVDYVAFPLASYPDSEVAAYGKEKADLFRTIGLSRITVTSSLADAQKIRTQVKNNSLSFEDAAKSHSRDVYADKGGDAGTVYYHLFAKDFSKPEDASAVAALRKGDLSEVYKFGDKTWAFFRINAEATEPDFTNAEALKEVRSYLEDSEKGRLEAWALSRANEFAAAAGTSSFRTAARTAGLAVKSAGPFTVNIGDPSFSAYGQNVPLFENPDTTNASELIGASENEVFLSEAFSLAKDKVSKSVVLGDNVIVFAVTDDADAKDADLAMINFAYPYYYQQTMDLQIRDTFLKSPKFKDNFATEFFKVFNSNTTTSSPAANTTATTVAPAQESTTPATVK